MGTFAEITITDYHLSFADQEKLIPFPVSICSKQTEVCHFRSPFAANKRKLPFSISSVFHVCLCLGCVCVHVYIFIHFKRKTESQAIFLNPFTICSLCK